MHLDTYPHLKPKLMLRKERPDLVGSDNCGRWVVIEAKGRTDKAKKDLMPKAKRQTTRLRRIQGVWPDLRVGIVSHFTRNGHELMLEDPAEIDANARDLELDDREFLSLYYRLFLQIAAAQEPDKEIIQHGRPIKLYVLEPVDLWIGIDSVLLSVLQQHDTFLSRSEARQVLAVQGPHHEFETSGPTSVDPDFAYIGRDGIGVVLGESWAEDHMIMEPADRPHRA